TRPPEVTRTGVERNEFFLRPILVLQCNAARMALGDASWYAAPVDHHSGSTGSKYPPSSWPQPMVDNSRLCAAGKSDRLMGVCVPPMAEPRLGARGRDRLRYEADVSRRARDIRFRGQTGHRADIAE